MPDDPAKAASEWSLETFATTLHRYFHEGSPAEVQAQAIRGVEILLSLGHPMPAAAVACFAEIALADLDEGVVPAWPWKLDRDA